MRRELYNSIGCSILRVTEIKTHRVKGRHWPRFPWLFIEVETDEGITGLGESLHYRSSGVYDSLDAIRSRLVGKDPTEITLIWEELFREGFDTAAISGVEMAFWDILGQSLNAPIHALLGGKCRDRVEVYVDGFFRGAEYVEEEYVKKALDAVEQGFKALKMDVDEPVPSGHSINRTLTSRDMEYTVKMVRAVREAVGNDIRLAIDCHGAFDVTTAIKLCRRLQSFDLMWVEDPVPQNNLKAMAKVCRESEIPICTGELLRTRFEFRELFEREAADIIMPDVARTGGMLELYKIAANSDTYYVPVAPHNMVGPIATMASAQVCACIPNFLVLEFQLGDVEWRDRVLDVPVPIKNGQIDVPDKPGLGVRLNLEELKEHVIY